MCSEIGILPFLKEKYRSKNMSSDILASLLFVTFGDNVPQSPTHDCYLNGPSNSFVKFGLSSQQNKSYDNVTEHLTSRNNVS